MRHAMMPLLVAALVAGLATSPAAAEAPTSLVVQTVAEPPGLDLTATPASATAAVVFYNVQEALVKVDRHGKLVPWLAERWHTTDNRNYTFFLKRGVSFHNGREMTAADVKYVFERAITRKRSTRTPATTRRSATSSSGTTTRSRSRSRASTRTSSSTWRARARSFTRARPWTR